MNHRSEPAQKDFDVTDAAPIRPKLEKPRVRIVNGRYVPVEQTAK